MLRSKLQYKALSSALAEVRILDCVSPRSIGFSLIAVGPKVVANEGFHSRGDGIVSSTAYYSTRKKFYGAALQGEVLCKSYGHQSIWLAMWFQLKLGYRFFEIQEFVDSTT